MTPRERQLSAIRHEMPDRIPVDVISIENAGGVAAQLGVGADEVADALGIDGRVVAAAYTGPQRPAENGTSFDQWGTVPGAWLHTTMRAPLAGAESVGEVERYAWPDVSKNDFAEAARRARELNERYAVRGPSGTPVFSRACMLLGFEEALTALVTNPAVFDAVMDRISWYVAGYCARLADACGEALPILRIWDDFATQRGLLMSPEQWRRHVKPYLARIFAVAKQKGRYMWFHSCGNITDVLHDLVDMGMDVWETVQLHCQSMSREELKREFGRHITFFGGISTQALPFKTLEAVREEVTECVTALGKGGGYICGPDHILKSDVPPGHTIGLFETARAFRRAGYTLEA